MFDHEMLHHDTQEFSIKKVPCMQMIKKNIIFDQNESKNQNDTKK